MEIPSAITSCESRELTRLAENALVLEIGSLLGYSTTVLAKAAHLVHSVDPHEGYPADNPRPTLQPFIKNLVDAGIREKVAIHVGYDHEILPFFKDGAFDLVFIDITGLYQDTLQAMIRSVPKLRHSGVLCVHDCRHPKWPGATRAVRDFSDVYRRPYRTVDRLAIFDRQTWGGQK